MTALSNPMDQFQQKILDQIKTNISGLLPDEAIQGLIERAVKELFFDRKRIPKPHRPYLSEEMIDGPSWFMDEVSRQTTPLLQAHIAERIDTYLKDNPQTIKDVIDAALGKDKVALTMSFVVATQLQAQMGQMVGAAIQEIRNPGRIQHGW